MAAENAPGGRSKNDRPRNHRSLETPVVDTANVRVRIRVAVKNRVFVDAAQRDQRRVILPGESRVRVDVPQKITREILPVLAGLIDEVDEELELLPMLHGPAQGREHLPCFARHVEIGGQVNAALLQAEKQMVKLVHLDGIELRRPLVHCLRQLRVMMMKTHRVVTARREAIGQPAGGGLVGKVGLPAKVDPVKAHRFVRALFENEFPVADDQSPVFSRRAIEQRREVERRPRRDILRPVELFPLVGCGADVRDGGWRHEE
ncbi:MAG: hypothetical protein K0R17_483 [Rariglobus sp.]|nr:hypothetical protein [Rariglobus sp.]